MLSLASILPIIYGLKWLARDGWQVAAIGLIAAGLAVGAVFVRRQKRLADPLLDLRLFASRSFTVTLGSMLTYSMLSGGTMVFVAQYFQLVAGLSPLRAGLALVPGMVASILSFQVAPLLGRRIRPSYLIPAGLAMSVVGLLVMTRSGTSGVATLIVGFGLSCLGTGPLVALGTNLIIGSAAPERAGSAAALGQTSGEFGYALGIAVLGSIMTVVYRTRMADALPAGAPSAAHDTIAGATQVARHPPDQVGGAILAAAHRAFVDGLHTVAALSAVILAGVAVLLFSTLRRVPALGRDQTETGHAGPTHQADTEATCRHHQGNGEPDDQVRDPDLRAGTR